MLAPLVLARLSMPSRAQAAAKAEETIAQTEALADQAAARGNSWSEYDDAAVHAPPASCANAHVSSLAQYKEMHERSIRDPAAFWGALARESLHWFRDFSEVCVGRGTPGCSS